MEERVAAGVGDEEAVCEAVRAGVQVLEGVPERVALSEVLRLIVGGGVLVTEFRVAEAEPLGEPDKLVLPVEVAVAEGEAEAVVEEEPVWPGEEEEVGVLELVPVQVAVPLRVRVLVAVLLAVSEGVPVGLGVSEGVRVREAVIEGVGAT